MRAHPLTPSKAPVNRLAMYVDSCRRSDALRVIAFGADRGLPLTRAIFGAGDSASSRTPCPVSANRQTGSEPSPVAGRLPGDTTLLETLFGEHPMPNEVSPRGVHRLELDSALGPWPYGMFPVLALTHRQRWAQTDGGGPSAGTARCAPMRVDRSGSAHGGIDRAHRSAQHANLARSARVQLAVVAAGHQLAELHPPRLGPGGGRRILAKSTDTLRELDVGHFHPAA